MIEITGELFEQECDAIFLTTNGYVKQPSGQAVMGLGVAKQAADRWKHLPGILGAAITNNGNRPQLLFESFETPFRWVGSFPVKPKVIFSTENNIVAHQRKNFPYGVVAPGWAAVADPHIIEASAQLLVLMTKQLEWKRVCLPRPGCGAGQLTWEQIRPILLKHFDDRFIIVQR